MFERRLYFHLDWALLATLLALSLHGHRDDLQRDAGDDAAALHRSRSMRCCSGAVALTIALSIDYRTLADKSHWIYIAIVLLLIYVMFFGLVRGGARRWISLGVFNLQPSEFAKIAVALVLAKFFGESRRQSPTRADLATGAAWPRCRFC